MSAFVLNGIVNALILMVVTITFLLQARADRDRRVLYLCVAAVTAILGVIIGMNTTGAFQGDQYRATARFINTFLYSLLWALGWVALPRRKSLWTRNSKQS